MNLYAETSAVLSWLLGQDSGYRAYQALAEAELVFTSDLTLIECDRVLHRAAVTGQLDESVAIEARTIVETASAHWTLCAMDAEIVEASRRRFPHEPIRSLDAIHLSTAVFVRNLAPDVCMLSFDERIRQNAAALGFRIIPEEVLNS